LNDGRGSQTPLAAGVADAVVLADLSVGPESAALWTRSGSQFKNSVKDLRISRSVDRFTVDRLDQCIFQPT